MKNFETNLLLEPKTIWDELANYSLLMEYINNFLNDKTTKEPELKSKMFNSIYQYYDKICPEAEEYYAEKYINSIQKFLTEVEKCQKQ